MPEEGYSFDMPPPVAVSSILLASDIQVTSTIEGPLSKFLSKSLDFIDAAISGFTYDSRWP